MEFPKPVHQVCEKFGAVEVCVQFDGGLFSDDELAIKLDFQYQPWIAAILKQSILDV
jgi:hypothetical protein